MPTAFYTYVLFILYKLMPISPIRKKIKQEYKYNKNIRDHKKVADYMHEHYINKSLEDFPLVAKKNLKNKKIIWQFWGQGIDNNTPKIVKACLDSVQRYKGEYEVIVLTNNTIKEYIDLPDFVYDKLENNTQFKYAFFSDILRIALLSAYGGVWCDATIYLTDEIPENLLKKDFFMFQRGERPEDYKYWHKHNVDYFSWHKHFKVRLLNSFIIAKPNDSILEELRIILCNYWKKEDTFKHYFLFQIVFNEIIGRHENCDIISDIYPNIMTKNIEQEYSSTLWNEITKNNTIHKLTYYPKCVKNSILEYILKSVR